MAEVVGSKPDFIENAARNSASYLQTVRLWKVRGYQGVDYEECTLLGYKNPVRTSQETH
jgi:hypothetical protein